MLPLAFVEHVQRSSLCSCKHGLIIFLAGILPQLLPIYKLCTVLLSLHRKPLVAPADFHCPSDMLDGYLVSLEGFNQENTGPIPATCLPTTGVLTLTSARHGHPRDGDPRRSECRLHQGFPRSGTWRRAYLHQCTTHIISVLSSFSTAPPGETPLSLARLQVPSCREKSVD